MLPLPWVNFCWKKNLPSRSLPGKECAMQKSLDQAVPRLDLAVARGQFPRDHLNICLYLNVWKPAGTRQGAKLPVMVWIHGGAFVGGSGNTSGNGFANKGVILVSINYRLGRLGHFAFPALSAEHPEEQKGSYAFMDQIAALKWIQQNIPAFGGDPKNVTIFGFSAGGVSIHSLMTRPISPWTVPEGNRPFQRRKGWCSRGRPDQ